MKMACHSELAFRAPPITATVITGDSVHIVTSSSKHGGRKRFHKTERRESSKKGECYRCGKDHEAQSCPDKKSVCQKCIKGGIRHVLAEEEPSTSTKTTGDSCERRTGNGGLHNVQL